MVLFVLTFLTFVLNTTALVADEGERVEFNSSCRVSAYEGVAARASCSTAVWNLTVLSKEGSYILSKDGGQEALLLEKTGFTNQHAGIVDRFENIRQTCGKKLNCEVVSEAGLFDNCKGSQGAGAVWSVYVFADSLAKNRKDANFVLCELEESKTLIFDETLLPSFGQSLEELSKPSQIDTLRFFFTD